MSALKQWYSRTTNVGSAHEQGLIINEKTGANIAVSYNPKHAPLLAAAPDLFRGCQAAMAYLATPRSKFKSNRDEAERIIRDALEKAGGA